MKRSAVLLLVLACACSRGPDGKIHPGSTVRLEYKLDVDGKPFESTELHGPIEIIQGHGDLPAAIDKALLGMTAGQRADIDLPTGGGFGVRDPAKIKPLPLSTMGTMAGLVKPGKKILGFQDGKTVSGLVLEVKDGVARVDFNHPLADKALRYRLQIVAVDPPPSPN